MTPMHKGGRMGPPPPVVKAPKPRAPRKGRVSSKAEAIALSEKLLKGPPPPVVKAPKPTRVPRVPQRGRVRPKQAIPPADRREPRVRKLGR